MSGTRRKRHRGADAWFHAAAGRWHRLGLAASVRREAARVEAACKGLELLDQDDLRRLLHAGAAAGDAAGDPPWVLRLAVLAELAARTLGLRPFRTQLMGAVALHRGLLAELATGEGKTLAITLAAALEVVEGRCCQVVTANDYLAARDAEAMAPLYRAAGVEVGAVVGGMPPDVRRAIYAAGVAYTTAKELMADHLRDRLAAKSAGGHRRPWSGPQRQAVDPVLARRDACIVDEADHVLIDEAVTPLIISSKCEIPGLAEVCVRACEVARALVEGRHYRADRGRREIVLTDEGRHVMELGAADAGSFWDAAARREEFVINALRARHFHRRDHQYLVRDGKVVIIDEFTGRTMPDRTWSRGLHQAVEVQEGLVPTAATETLARMSFQTFFRGYPRLAGLSGTVREVTAECWAIYHLAVVPIEPNRPCRRIEWTSRVDVSLAAKEAAIVRHVAEMARTGRPVLVGTRSVESSERLAASLGAAGVLAAVLNARQDRDEAAVVAGAGRRQAVTIATNMAGRGTDIRLADGVAALGGLHVVAAEFNEARRIDRQLFGRGARQGDPGSAVAFVCPQDELLRRAVPGPVFRMFERAVGALPGWLLRGGLLAAVRLAQKRRQAEAARQRRALAQHEEWLADVLPWE